MGINIILTILLVHFFADFVLQTHEQASRKSKEVTYLMYHVLTYTLTWGAFYYLLINHDIFNILFFMLITFISHTMTDFVTSHYTSKFFKAGNYHDGFVMVGFDQILHYIQLGITITALN